MRVDASPDGTPIRTVDDLKHIENGSYYLENDIGDDTTTSDWHIVLQDKNITLDLNGQTIKNLRIYMYGRQLTLTLNDSVGGGKIDNENVNNGETIHIESDNKLIMNNGTLCNNTSGSAVENKGEFIMNGGSISNNHFYNYGAGVSNEGSFTMNGGAIYNNIVNNSGGGVYNSYSFTMNGGAIYNNEAGSESGGVLNDGSFTMNGGSIYNNKANDNGGGVCNRLGGTFIINGGSISNNKSSNGNGGGVVNEQTFIMNGGSIYNNEALGYGGGIHNNMYGIFSLNKGSITYNKAFAGGGVLNFNIFTINGGSISNNEAWGSGGGIYNDQTLTMNNATITNNKSGQEGGGIYTDQLITINGGTINNNINTSNNSDGDIYFSTINDDYTSTIANSPNIGTIKFENFQNKHSFITLLDPLTNTTPIGIGFHGGNAPFTFTKKSDGGPNPSDYVFNFKSVNPDYGIGLDGNELKLDTAATAPTNKSIVPSNIEKKYGYSDLEPLQANITFDDNREILSYQWYKNTTNSNIGGTPIAGATESTYTIPNGFGIGKYFYYCLVTTKNNNNVFRQDPSNVGTLIVSKGDARYTTDVTAKNGLTEEKTPQELVNPGTTSFGNIQYALGDNDTTAPSTGWSTSIPTGTNAGLYHVWYKVAGTSNYNGIDSKCVNATINYKPGTYPSIPVTPGKIKNITGSKDAYQESNIYNTIIENEDELATLLDITDEEIAKGVNVWFDAQDATDSTLDADKAIIDAARGDYQVGNYLTINVYKKVGNGFSYSKVKETNGKVKMKLTFSDSLKKQGRNFAIVGVHNLKGTLIGGSYNFDANTFSFANNEFSPYALVYKDELNLQAPATGVTAKVSAVPKTGD